MANSFIYNNVVRDTQELKQPSANRSPATPNIVPSSGNTILKNGDFASANFRSGLTGWLLDSEGNLEANKGNFRGDITGASGTFSGVLTGGSLNIPDITTANSFHVDTAGNAWWGATTLGTALAKVLNSGVATFKNITANTVGTIGGFTLSSAALYAGTGASRIQLDATNGIYLGANLAADAPFRVSLAGALVATNATITGAITASSGTIGGFTIGSTALYGGIIKTAATVGAGSTGVIMDTDGLRGYDSVLGLTFELPTDGGAPTFSSGVISSSSFEINTNSVLRTSATVGDGSASSAGILINNTGFYGCAANQTLANANVKVLIDGSAVFNANVRGGQTDYNTGIGYFLGLSGGDYKLSIGDPDTNYLNWDGTYLKLKGSFEVGANGIVNNSVYTVATLPIAATVVGFEVPSAYE